MNRAERRRRARAQAKAAALRTPNPNLARPGTKLPVVRSHREVVEVAGKRLIAIDPKEAGVEHGSFDHGALASQCHAIAQLPDLPNLAGYLPSIETVIDQGTSVHPAYHERVDAGLPIIHRDTAALIAMGAPRVGEVTPEEQRWQDELERYICAAFGVESPEELSDREQALLRLFYAMAIVAVRPMANAVSGYVNDLAGRVVNELAHNMELTLRVDRWVGRRAKQLAKREYESHERELRHLVPDGRKAVADVRLKMQALQEQLDRMKAELAEVGA